jgi:hypothetical protein
LILKRIGIISLAKMSGILYACMGLIFGAILTIASLIGGAVGVASGIDPAAGFFGLIFGVGAILILPIFYGVMGAIVGAIGGAIYNLVASVAGGVELELVEK